MRRIGVVVPKLLALGIALALVPAGAKADVPVVYPPPVLTEVTINDSAGDQTNPHVSGDWVEYEDGHIRYYNFMTGTDALIPPEGSPSDLLADISGSRIVFSRV